MTCRSKFMRKRRVIWDTNFGHAIVILLRALLNLLGTKSFRYSTPDSETGEPYLGLLLKNGADERELWFLRDEEDNGAGFFDINPMFKDNELEGC